MPVARFERTDKPQTLSAQKADSPYDGAKAHDKAVTVPEHTGNTSAVDSTALIVHPDIARLASLWPIMPEHIRAAIKALVGTVQQ